MKKLIVVTALIIIAATLGGKTLSSAQRTDLRIETHDESFYQGTFLYRDGQVFWLKTKQGKTPVLQREIKTVFNKKGDDITQDFLALEAEPPTRITLENANTIAIPIWFLALLTAFSIVRAL
jgi:hypothetical protein